eukprot:CAMPEP_0171569352 /NCGR_PEP_ID=MMETSP0961-20121227/2299_1 /TAXON_ID=87120 /ORGANISM="Aurantiochytrium limacinum, Strain ATCCMYA-1381" /LENGTH=460 /DNA_ID=CAMNT_0012123637 /DNA_START=228 /DNA_END=1607 /DNA_ORIENTATION=+
MSVEVAKEIAGPGSGRGWLELSKRAINVDFSGHKVWYDNANEQLVLMKKNVYYTLPLNYGARLSPPLNFVHAGPVLDVKFSLCKRFMAIQRNDTTIEVVDLLLATETRITCRPKRGNLVLRGGVFWLQRDSQGNNTGSSSMSLGSGGSTGGTKFFDSEDLPTLCIVARCGLEVHRLPNTERGEETCKLVGTIKHAVHCFWYIADQQLVLLATGTGTELRPYQFQNGHLPIKLAKFSVAKVLSHRDMLVTKLYGSIYAIEVVQSTRKLQLYRLGRETSALVRELDLTLRGSVYLSIVDNLICVHNMEGKFTCIYDIQADTNLPCIVPKSLHCAWQDPAKELSRASATKPTSFDIVLHEGESIGLEPIDPHSAQNSHERESLHQKDQQQGQDELTENKLCQPKDELKSKPFWSARLTQMSLYDTYESEVLVGSALTHLNDMPLDGKAFEYVLDSIDEADRPV